MYFDQIALHDEYLKAILIVSPMALLQAAALDKERMQGHVRGPLHGIPILVKVSHSTRTQAF